MKPETFGEEPDTSFIAARAHYRLLFLKHYCANLLKAQDEGELSSLEATAASRLVNISLKGTSPERVKGNFRVRRYLSYLTLKQST